MKQKILLTGGAGYIGSHTAVELLQAGYEVVIVDNFCNSSPKILQRIEQITGQPVKFYKLNVVDKQAMERIFQENQIDSVIHFAGLKAVGESVQKPLKYYRNNLDSTLTLLEIMLDYSVNKIVFSSSATVYGIPDTVPLTEDMPTSCLNPYGWTKLMIEQIMRDVGFAEDSLSVVLLRYFNPIGAHESGLIGEMPQGVPNNLLPYVSAVAAGKLEYLSIFGDDYPTSDGTGVRDYIHVVDLAKGHLAALKYVSQHSGIDVFNLGTGKGYSVLQIVHTFEKVNHVKVPYIIAPRRNGDVAECYAATDKAESLLGWRAEKDLTEMCRDAWRWQQNIF